MSLFLNRSNLIFPRSSYSQLLLLYCSAIFIAVTVGNGYTTASNYCFYAVLKFRCSVGTNMLIDPFHCRHFDLKWPDVHKCVSEGKQSWAFYDLHERIRESVSTLAGCSESKSKFVSEALVQS